LRRRASAFAAHRRASRLAAHRQSTTYDRLDMKRGRTPDLPSLFRLLFVYIVV
jgi:hypothetical protein